MAFAAIFGFWLNVQDELLHVNSVGDVFVTVVHLAGWLGLIVVGLAMMTRHTRLLGDDG
jgi:hypothetical protein